MVPEAPLRETPHGLVPEGEGWFVVDTREALWKQNDAFGLYCTFEGAARFPRLGINVSVLAPGQPGCLYHGEDEQEDFLVLAGECLLLVEGEERPLRAWDFVHCPPWTEHVFVGAGEGPCVLLAVGTRTGDGVVYPVSELARRHGAGVAAEARSGRQAYAGYPEDVPARYREGSLPGA